jgi:MFS family permease
LKDSRLVIFATSLFLFQLANASVLPLAGEALVRMSETDSSLVISALIIVPQIIVALMAPSVGRQAQVWGRRPLLLIGFAALPIRALGFALISDPLVLLAVQALDGISATVLGVLTALVIADLTGGTGRFKLSAGHCWDSIWHRRLNQHDAIRASCRETWFQRGVFGYRRHRVARDTRDFVSDAGDKTTD